MLILTILLLCIGFNNAYCQNSDVSYTKSDKNKTNEQVDVSWLMYLPACPCINPDLNGIKTNDGWAKDRGNIQKNHSGATECFRSYPYVKTSEGKSGQQCCYDEKGNLITQGTGAGTLDKVSPCSGEKSNGNMKVKLSILIGHFINDVKPSKKLGEKSERWKIYNKIWQPNNANNCPENIISP